jgi:hypothetical protein
MFDSNGSDWVDGACATKGVGAVFGETKVFDFALSTSGFRKGVY